MREFQNLFPANSSIDRPGIKHAGRWKLLLVRIFGRRVEAQDGDVKIIGYWYRGKLFIAKEINLQPNAVKRGNLSAWGHWKP